MAKQLTSLEELQQEERHNREQQSRLAELDEELALYHPDGPWRFMEKRLTEIAAGALEALVFCPLEEVERYRERLKLVRHLASLREVLAEERAQLQESIENDGQPV